MKNDILLNTVDGVATITLNRPERLNAISIATLDLLINALDKVSTNIDVRAVVLAGAGKLFCAGADQNDMVPRESMEWERLVDHYLDPVRRIANMDKPVIARLHGDCIGGGLGIAMACDFRIAAEGIRLAAPFVNIGLAGCDMSAGYFLPRLVGLGRATDIMMSGRFTDRSRWIWKRNSTTRSSLKSSVSRARTTAKASRRFVKSVSLSTREPNVAGDGTTLSDHVAMDKLSIGLRIEHELVSEGYMNESPVQRFYRDRKVLELGEGSSEIQRETIARTL